ncbi:hypothetical protein FGE12_04775 [Aggregicoccus sp. 17bor-14]|uniref:hypothetical protein n=1 Tax=Myxococcaceae TaxID=31 RepID=UPI00129C85ED|nr:MULTISPECIES: hypothetical protein [Myxococcaceae]MBF5041693.1 hypothetical protein [Simulacricoccus sp. 17bor-14]MRI87475.1 hypothetical protein [Aggregicoccus sp. 17bor-14]
MEPLPFVDEHSRRVNATPERPWKALVGLVRSRMSDPAARAFVAAWRLEPASGFGIAEQVEPSQLTLRGRHRFSRYELAFHLEPGPDGVIVSARTSADFPGLAGRTYRALVIGTRMHRFFVRQMLASVAREAERAG